jgi:hypothetical protein
MPRYYFHLVSPANPVRDRTRVELAGLTAASDSINNERFVRGRNLLVPEVPLAPASEGHRVTLALESGKDWRKRSSNGRVRPALSHGKPASAGALGLGSLGRKNVNLISPGGVRAMTGVI